MARRHQEKWMTPELKSAIAEGRRLVSDKEHATLIIPYLGFQTKSLLKFVAYGGEPSYWTFYDYAPYRFHRWSFRR